MLSVSNPRWLFLVNTLPLFLLFLLGYHQFTLIDSLLDGYALRVWQSVGFWTLALLLGVAAVGGFYASRQAETPFGVIGGLFVATAAYVTLVLNADADLQPSGMVPRWLRMREAGLYVLTAVMPTLAYCLFVAVDYSVKRNNKQTVAIVIGQMVSVPVAAAIVMYLMVTIVIPFLGDGGERLIEHIMTVVVITLTTLFLFLLLRALYLLWLRRNNPISEPGLLWLVPLAILFPLAGLALNNGDIPDGLINFDKMFGDFSHPFFYLIAGINGLLLCLPAYDGKLYRLFLYLARAVGFTFIIYFFLVFLPYLPLSLPALLFFGLGILMLTPLMLFPIQFKALREDWQYLRKYFEKPFLVLLTVMALALLPTLLTLDYARDDAALTTALNHVYAPAENGPETVVKERRLRRVLDRLSSRNDRTGFGRLVEGTPYLDRYYDWLVLDNLMLSSAKINDLRAVFFGEQTPVHGSFQRRRDDQIVPTAYDIATERTADGTAYRSTVTIALTNHGTRGRAEFFTEFDLPDGVFVDDYFLDIDGRREYGILAERRAATFVYNNIVSVNRDPGFLRYVTANRLALNVFPFNAEQTRTTGITFLHREPVTLNIAGQEFKLAAPDYEPSLTPVELPGGGLYFSVAAKEALPQVQRPTGKHYLLDATQSDPVAVDQLIERLKAHHATQPADAPEPRLTLVGTYPRRIDWNADWRAEMSDMAGGGYFFQRAVEQALVAELDSPSPVDYDFVVVLAPGVPSVKTDRFSAFRAALPDGPTYEYLRADTNAVRRLSLAEPIATRYENTPEYWTGSSLHRYAHPNGKTYYLPANGQPSLLPGTAEAATDSQNISLPWEGAATAYTTYLVNRRDGQTGYRPWLNEVRQSFRQDVLMPTTAFLSLENEAQKEALRRKQEQVLKADPMLDLSDEDDPQRMPEPRWVWVIGLFLFAGFAWRR